MDFIKIKTSSSLKTLLRNWKILHSLASIFPMYICEEKRLASRLHKKLITLGVKKKEIKAFFLKKWEELWTHRYICPIITKTVFFFNKYSSRNFNLELQWVPLYTGKWSFQCGKDTMCLKISFSTIEYLKCHHLGKKKSVSYEVKHILIILIQCNL